MKNNGNNVFDLSLQGEAGNDTVTGTTLNAAEELVGDLTHENALALFQEANDNLNVVTQTEDAIATYTAAASKLGEITKENATSLLSAYTNLVDSANLTPEHLSTMGLDQVTVENANTQPGETMELTRENADGLIKRLKDRIMKIIIDAQDSLKSSIISIFQGLTSVESKATKLAAALNNDYTDEFIDKAKAPISLYAKYFPIIGKVDASAIEAMLVSSSSKNAADAIVAASKNVEDIKFQSTGYEDCVKKFTADDNVEAAVVTRGIGKKMHAVVQDKEGKVSVKTVEVTDVDGFKETDLLTRAELIKLAGSLVLQTKKQKESIEQVLKSVGTIRGIVEKVEDSEKLKTLTPIISASTAGLFTNASTIGMTSKYVAAIVASGAVLLKKKEK